jgi:hypothetical protein
MCWLFTAKMSWFEVLNSLYCYCVQKSREEFVEMGKPEPYPLVEYFTYTWTNALAPNIFTVEPGSGSKIQHYSGRLCDSREVHKGYYHAG